MKKIYKKLLAAGLGTVLALSIAACSTNKETAKKRGQSKSPQDCDERDLCTF